MKIESEFIPLTSLSLHSSMSVSFSCLELHISVSQPPGATRCVSTACPPTLTPASPRAMSQKPGSTLRALDLSLMSGKQSHKDVPKGLLVLYYLKKDLVFSVKTNCNCNPVKPKPLPLSLQGANHKISA